MIDFNSIRENWETVINLKLLGIIVSMRFPMMQLDSKEHFACGVTSLSSQAFSLVSSWNGIIKLISDDDESIRTPLVHYKNFPTLLEQLFGWLIFAMMHVSKVNTTLSYLETP